MNEINIPYLCCVNGQLFINKICIRLWQVHGMIFTRYPLSFISFIIDLFCLAINMFLLFVFHGKNNTFVVIVYFFMVIFFAFVFTVCLIANVCKHIILESNFIRHGNLFNNGILCMNEYTCSIRVYNVPNYYNSNYLCTEYIFLL